MSLYRPCEVICYTDYSKYRVYYYPHYYKPVLAKGLLFLITGEYAGNKPYSTGSVVKMISSKMITVGAEVDDILDM